MTTTTSTSRCVTVSAPGKILLAGGYLVLESPNVGFVVAADKRFYTTISTEDDTTKGESNDLTTTISVISPQFHMKWNYLYHWASGILSTSEDNDSYNPFVEKTLRVSLLYLSQPQQHLNLPHSLTITICADNDFYSVLPHLQDDRTPAAVAALPKFLKCPLDANSGKAIVNKTGLGSSAALTTSLVGALVHFFRQDQKLSTINDDNQQKVIDMIHNLSQICHCHAQGKVGSGFDVSAACYGTHVYRRFPKCLLPDMLQQLEAFDQNDSHNETEKSSNVRDALARLVELIPWKEDMVEPVTFPKGQLQILLADVRGGSESPSMARKVLNWKINGSHNQHHGGSSNYEIPHWTALSRLNAKVVEVMQQLTQYPPTSQEYDTLATLSTSAWPKDSPLTALHNTFLEIRANLRSMGEAAGVPIEPQPQTALCDATMNIPGVVTALVPGAGGYDAVACLYIDRPAVLEAIGKMWSEWKEPIICPLAVKECDGGLQLEAITS